MPEEEKHQYVTKATWTEGRMGSYEFQNGSSGTFTPPPEFNGQEGYLTPEDAFCGAISTCFMLTGLTMTKKLKLGLKSFEVETIADLERVDGPFQFTKVVIRPKMIVDDAEKAQKVLEMAKKYCLVTASIKSQIVLEPEIIVE